MKKADCLKQVHTCSQKLRLAESVQSGQMEEVMVGLREGMAGVRVMKDYVSF